ncbi:MAG: lysozyme family protein [Planctomycetota bacterium]|jgi:hypothetical protein
MGFCSLFVLHVWLVANIPPAMGATICLEAQSWGERYDTAALLISEHSGGRSDFSPASLLVGDRPTYETDTTSPRGAVGVMQLWRGWAREFDVDPEELFSATTNIRVGILAARYMRESHADCDADSHHWVAHYKCASRSRDDTRGPCAYAQRKWVRVRDSLTVGVDH